MSYTSGNSFLRLQCNHTSLCRDKTPALCSQLTALRVQVYHLNDCKRKCSLFIYGRCSVILQVEALVADLCGLFPFHQATNDSFNQANSASFSYQYSLKKLSAFSGSIRFVPV